MSLPPLDSASSPSPASLESTGVPQLDHVLGGGLPRGTLAVILGPPGSGKTTLASQIAFAAAGRGQRVLILTALSEPTTKLLEHLASYRFFVPELVGSLVQVFSLQQFLPQGAATTVQEIVAAVRQTRASLVMLDGFQGLRNMESSTSITRQLLYDLGTRLSLLGTTTLITTEADPRDPALFPEMTTGDVLLGLYYNLQGMRAFRSIEVIKARGRAPLPGLHSLMLNSSGVEVFPRLEAQLLASFKQGELVDISNIQAQERASFDVPELDTLLNGGLTRHTGTLLAGSLGTGKTLLAVLFALAGVRNQEPVVYLGFRETAEQLVQKADAFDLGAQLRQALAPGGLLTLQHWEPVELDPDQVAMTLLATIERTGARRVVIDSVVELERAVKEHSGDERFPNYLAGLLATLRIRGVTLLAIKELHKGIAILPDFFADALAVLTENVLLLQQIVYSRQLVRVLSVLKMRFSAHDFMLREFVIAPPDGIRVLSPQESGEDTLGGLLEVQGGLSERNIHLIGREPPSAR